MKATTLVSIIAGASLLLSTGCASNKKINSRDFQAVSEDINLKIEQYMHWGVGVGIENIGQTVIDVPDQPYSNEENEDIVVDIPNLNFQLNYRWFHVGVGLPLQFEDRSLRAWGTYTLDLPEEDNVKFNGLTELVWNSEATPAYEAGLTFYLNKQARMGFILGLGKQDYTAILKADFSDCENTTYGSIKNYTSAKEEMRVDYTGWSPQFGIALRTKNDGRLTINLIGRIQDINTHGSIEEYNLPEKKFIKGAEINFIIPLTTKKTMQ
ncbi:hypothetical protein K9M74_00890 [Candidatus Woesearchaeota archaeon]|nr:hypothetical protein [Candidatus Woesearchaeota archaeon]